MATAKAAKIGDTNIETSDDKNTKQNRFFLPDRLYLLNTFRPIHTGIPMIMAGTAMPATRAIPTGAPISVPNCHNNFFFFDHGLVPQNVQPDGLK
jgi:hypothetical protein